MTRIRELRKSHNYTQQQLAEMLKTTQQTIARWESGRAEPNLSALRDLAMIFGTSVDDLLGRNPLSKKITSNSYYVFNPDPHSDGFWGHVGLLLTGESKTKWFPITLSTAEELGAFLANADPGDWVLISTLKNRMLAVNPSLVRRIWLLDDACDEPDDWSEEAKEDYDGLPMEFYRGLDAHFSSGEEDLETTASETFRSIISDYVREKELDEESANKLLHYSTIYLSDGTQATYWAEPKDLYELVFNIDSETVPALIGIDSYGGGFESYYPSNKVALVEMPLLDLVDYSKQEMDELEPAEGG